MAEDAPHEVGMVTGVLRTAAHFRNLSDEDLARLARIFAVRQVVTGATIFQSGDDADGLFVVASGVVVVFRKQPTEESRPLARLRRGDLLGTADLFDVERRTETARATEDSVVLHGPRSDLLGFLEDHPQVALNLRLAAARSHTERAKVALTVAQRRAVRHRVNQEVRLSLAGTGRLSATLVDLATLGMSLRRAPQAWEPDSIVSYRLEWAERRLDLTGRIAWREGDYVGIELQNPSATLQAKIQETLEEMLLSAQ